MDNGQRHEIVDPGFSVKSIIYGATQGILDKIRLLQYSLYGLNQANYFEFEQLREKSLKVEISLLFLFYCRTRSSVARVHEKTKSKILGVLSL